MLPGLFLTLFAFISVAATAPAPKGEFPDDYYFSGNVQGVVNKYRALEGKAPPKLTLKNWIGEKQDLAKLKGKVVIVDFWGTWCPPCMASLPHNVEMYNKYKDKGLVIIGVSTPKGSEKMADVAKDKKIKYPLGVDDDSKSEKAWNIGFWPSYFVIDRKGIVRAGGLTPDNVEKVVEKLLKEKAPEAPKPPAEKPATPPASPPTDKPATPPAGDQPAKP